MSLQPVWEKIIEIAEQARLEALGAPLLTNDRNAGLVVDQLNEIYAIDNERLIVADAEICEDDGEYE